MTKEELIETLMHCLCVEQEKVNMEMREINEFTNKGNSYFETNPIYETVKHLERASKCEGKQELMATILSILNIAI